MTLRELKRKYADVQLMLARRTTAEQTWRTVYKERRAMNDEVARALDGIASWTLDPMAKIEATEAATRLRKGFRRQRRAQVIEAKHREERTMTERQQLAIAVLIVVLVIVGVFVLAGTTGGGEFEIPYPTTDPIYGSMTVGHGRVPDSL